ncbi:MAG: hypothetical protein ACK5HR_05575 [Mycoplasmatales bacterium]
MKGSFYAIIFMVFGIFLLFLSIDYMKINMKILNNKDDLWKESLYYGSNKSYFRTASTTSEGTSLDNLSLAQLYCKDIEGDSCVDSTYDFGTGEEPVNNNGQLEMELIKDVYYFLNMTGFSYKIAAKEIPDTEKKETGCKFNIYIARNTNTEESIGKGFDAARNYINGYNTVKISLCERE